MRCHGPKPQRTALGAADVLVNVYLDFCFSAAPFLRRPGSLRLPLIENVLLPFPASLLRIDSLSLWFLIENPTLSMPSLLVHLDPHVSATHRIVLVPATVVPATV